jgi:hypothetical protein
MKAICLAVGLMLSATTGRRAVADHQDARPAPQGRRQGEPRRAGARARPDGKPDLTGIWQSAGGQGELNGLETLRVDPADMKPWAIELQQQRSHDYFKSRPTSCAVQAGWKPKPTSARSASCRRPR